MEPGQLPNGMYQVTTPDYFDLVHIPLVAGRLLTETDGADAPKVALISQRMADRWWKNESPIGKHIRLGGLDSKAPWLTIVGVVGDIMHNPYDREPRRTIYVPFAAGAAVVDGHRRSHRGRPAGAGARPSAPRFAPWIASSPSPTCAPWSGRFTIAPSA